MDVPIDPDTADAILALSIASGLTPSAVLQRLVETIAPTPTTPRPQQPRPPRRWPLAAATAAAGFLLVATVVRRAHRT